MEKARTTHARRRIVVELREDVATAALSVLRHQDGDESLMVAPAAVAIERALRMSETGARRGASGSEAAQGA